MKRAWWYIAGLVVGLVMVILVQSPSGIAKMVVCDVGQGDAILIIKDSYQVLVDGGPSSEKILSCLERHIPFWDRTIELIVLTNTDYDHMNGLSAVVDRYQVIHFVTSDGVHDSQALGHFAQTLSNRGVEAIGVEQGDLLRVGAEHGLQLSVLWPPELIEEYVAVFTNQMDNVQREQVLGASAKRGDLNERSVVLLLLEGETSVLLTGDVGHQTEQTLLASGLLSDVDILKVGHHGSKYSTSLEFLHATRPEIAVISAGAKNRYGHPTMEVINNLESIGVVIHRTDQDGDVVLEIE